MLTRQALTAELDDWWYPGQLAVYVHCIRNWTLGHPAFSRSLGQLSQAVRTPWLLCECKGDTQSRI